MHIHLLGIHISIHARTSYDMLTEPSGKLEVADDKTKCLGILVKRLTFRCRKNVGQEEKFIASLNMDDFKLDINRNYEGKTLAHKAAENNWKAAVRKLIELGADHLAERDVLTLERRSFTWPS